MTAGGFFALSMTLGAGITTWALATRPPRANQGTFIGAAVVFAILALVCGWKLYGVVRVYFLRKPVVQRQKRRRLR